MVRRCCLCSTQRHEEPHGYGSKQNLNTKSLTEAELVGVDNVVSEIIWTQYFLQAQGYGVNDNIIYQDNLSAMKFGMNRRKSSSKRTRDINIRYYFVTDRISTDEISIEHCPTLEMIGYYFTKPLQGKQFKDFRNIILGIEEDNVAGYNTAARAYIQTLIDQADSSTDHRSVLESNESHTNQSNCVCRTDTLGSQIPDSYSDTAYNN